MTNSATMPRRAHPGDAGFDLFADEDVVIAPGVWARIKTGLAIQLPEGTEGQIRPRSGLAAEHGLTVLNSPGTIDSGYRGPIDVLLINHGLKPFAVRKGARIAQLVIAPIFGESAEEVEELEDSERGARGFGSSEGVRNDGAN